MGAREAKRTVNASDPWKNGRGVKAACSAGKAVAAQANAVIANQNNTASLRSRSQNPAASNAQSSAAAPNMCRESTWIA